MMLLVALVFAANLITPPSPAPGDVSNCKIEPASQWAPQGYICPPIYGIGTASRYEGNGVARNDCTWPFTACTPIRITALDTGKTVVVTPVTWCMCWVGVIGPNGETDRIVDLDPATVAILGLDWSRGLYRVRVEPATGAERSGTLDLPDTAMTP